MSQTTEQNSHKQPNKTVTNNRKLAKSDNFICTNKCFFVIVDPSIGTAALGLGPSDLINDLDTFGLLFENMAVRDLRVYADALMGEVRHYRDSDGLECDAVLHRRNGTYGLIEIKLGGVDLIKKGVATLNDLDDKIDTTKMKTPSFKMVLTAVGEYAYKQADGVYVVPIGCLKP